MRRRRRRLWRRSLVQSYKSGLRDILNWADFTTTSVITVAKSVDVYKTRSADFAATGLRDHVTMEAMRPTAIWPITSIEFSSMVWLPLHTAPERPCKIEGKASIQYAFIHRTIHRVWWQNQNLFLDGFVIWWKTRKSIDICNQTIHWDPSLQGLSYPDSNLDGGSHHNNSLNRILNVLPLRNGR